MYSLTNIYIFSQTRAFEIATEQFISKAKVASASLSKLIYSLKINSFEIYCKLFESHVKFEYYIQILSNDA